MKRPIYFYYLLFFLFATIVNSYSQEKKTIQIKYTGAFSKDEAKFPGVSFFTRNDQQQVHIIHKDMNLWCDKAVHYKNEDFIEAYGNVKMIQNDTITMASKYIEYSGKTQLFFASGDVVLKDPSSTILTDTLHFDRIKEQAFYRSGGTVVKDSTVTITSKVGRFYLKQNKYRFTQDVVLVNEEATIKSNYFDFYLDTNQAYLYGPSTITTEESVTYCEKGFYNTESKIGYVLKNAKIDYKDQIIEGDSLYFDNSRSFASATNNIKVTDTTNHSVVKGHYAEVFKSKDSLFITKRALAITVQENDSIYMHADKITVTGKEDHRIIKAYYNAKIYKTDLSAKADSIHADQKTGLSKLINIAKNASIDKFSTARKPILWNLENQMTGDTIHLISNPKTEKLDSLIVFNNAFVIGKDTTGVDNYNQIYGQRLVGQFNEENTLDRVDIIKNAESIYYARNEKKELIGIDKSKSGSIVMIFEDGEIEEFTKKNQIDGDLHPEEDFPKKEKLLKGFDWREDERPKSVEDLFSEDPPLDLPIIKGLEDYVPQEDFFDEELIERIDKADSESKIPEGSKPKASRNLPNKKDAVPAPVRKKKKLISSKSDTKERE